MYAARPATAAYKEAGVLTASPAQLVVMLYDGAVRFLRQSAMLLEDGDVPRSHGKLQRGEAIIQELLDTLDFERGGDIAPGLRDLYLFYLRHLGQARLDRSPEMIIQVATQLGELRESWAQIATG